MRTQLYSESLSVSFINKYLIKWNKRSANWMTCIEHEKENIPFDIVPWCSLLVIQKLWSLSMYPTILHVCVSLPFASTWKFFCINMASLQFTQIGFYSFWHRLLVPLADWRWITQYTCLFCKITKDIQSNNNNNIVLSMLYAEICPKVRRHNALPFGI